MKKSIFKKILLGALVCSVLSVYGCAGIDDVALTSDANTSDDNSIYEESSDNLIEVVNNLEEESAETDSSENQKTVDLILFMGQSNMAGYGGDASLAPTVSEEAGLEYRAISDPENLNPIVEPFGINEDNENGLQDKPDRKKGTLVSAFVNRYHEQTGHKVIAVSASVGGMAMDLWLIDSFKNDAISRITNSISFLEENGYNIENTFVVWLQGESDAIREENVITYKDNFYTFMDEVLAAGVEKVFLIAPGRTNDDPDVFKNIIAIQEEICQEREEFIMATEILSQLDASYLSDEVHYNQEALNMAGEAAADTVAEIAK